MTIEQVARFSLVRAMAIYFLNGWGEMEKRSFRCLFCAGIFEERNSLNAHYFETHAAAFSNEERSMAGVTVRRAHKTHRL